MKINDFEWNNLERARKAINTFGNKKAPGLDGVTPELMKLFSNKFLEVLIRLFNAILTLQYTPIIMRTSKVIMLAKPGKDDYTQPKAYRPISLTPFIFKLLERKILENSLNKIPFHTKQHA